MKKSEAVERLAVALLFSPSDVTLIRHYDTFKYHIKVGEETVCRHTVDRAVVTSTSTSNVLEDYVSRHVASEDWCRSCSRIWQEAIWKRNGLVAKPGRWGQDS